MTLLFCSPIIMPALVGSVAEGEEYMRFKRHKIEHGAHPLLQEHSGGVPGVDPGREGYMGNGHRPTEGLSIGGREGFTAFMGKTAVDPINQKERAEVRRVEDDYNRSLSEFARKTATLMGDARDYVRVTAPGGNPYASKIVKGTNGVLAYVTRYGECRRIPDATTYDNMAKRPGCGPYQELGADIPDAGEFQAPGVAGKLFVGRPVSSPFGEPCGLEGENVQVTMMADAHSMWEATGGGTKRRPSSVETGINDYQGGDEVGCLECIGQGKRWCWIDRNCYDEGDATSPCYDQLGSCVSSTVGTYDNMPNTVVQGNTVGSSSGEGGIGACKDLCDKTPFCQAINYQQGGDCYLKSGRERKKMKAAEGWSSMLLSGGCKTSSCSQKGAQAQAGAGLADTDDSRTTAFIGCVRSQGEDAYQTGGTQGVGGGSPADAGFVDSASTKSLLLQSDMGDRVTREQCLTRALDIQAGAFGLGNATTEGGLARGQCYTTDHRTSEIAPDGPCGEPGTRSRDAYTQSYVPRSEILPMWTSPPFAHGTARPEEIEYGVTRNGRFVATVANTFSDSMNSLQGGRVVVGVDGTADGPELYGNTLNSAVLPNMDTGVPSGFESCGVVNGGAFIPGSGAYTVDTNSCPSEVSDIGLPSPGQGASWTDVGMPATCSAVPTEACFDQDQKIVPARVPNTCPADAPVAYDNGNGPGSGCCGGKLGKSSVPGAEFCHGTASLCPEPGGCQDHRTHAQIENPLSTWATFYRSYCTKTCTKD